MWARMIAMTLALFGLAGAATAETRSVTGTVAYLERIALPPEAELVVTLVDVSLQDAPATTLASKGMALTGVPMPFELPYDSTAIDPAHSYAVQARIMLDGNLLFLTTQSYPVLTRGAGETVEIIVQRVTSGAVNLRNTDWTVTELNGTPLTLDRLPTISFGADMELAMFGGCNRLMGQVDADAGGFTLSGPMAGTLMACPDAVAQVERRLIEAVEKGTRYQSDGAELIVSDDAGNVLIRAGAGL